MTTFFVGGAERTGASVLQAILCHAAGTNPMIMDATYLSGLVKTYARAKSHWDFNTKDYFDDLDDLRQFHSKLIKEFLEFTASRHADTRHLVLKAPSLTKLFPELFELLPEVKFVLILRDPRDAIASLVEVGRKLSNKVQRRFFHKDNIVELSNYFLAFYGPIFSDNNAALMRSTHLIRYEDLVADPDTHLRSVCKFTGLDLDSYLSDQLRDCPFSPRFHSMKPTEWHVENYARELNTSSVGRHKTILDSREVREIEKHCRAFLEYFSYV